ncbi:MAG: hypothetical protein O2856_12340 [Planctomycetota bacterium]|nr:hypothetical protein [Planctomycetota bacterium]
MPHESLPGPGRQNVVSLDTAQWNQLREWAEAETGMDLSGSRFLRLQDAVTKVVSHQRITSLKHVISDTRQRSTFLEHVCAELTIGESFFLRNDHHFQALREHVLPGIFKQNAASKEIRIWSAGCATGEEPYSLAILLDQMLQSEAPQIANHKSQIGNWTVHILATDLNPEFLEQAREATYSQWSFRGTDINHDRDYFIPEGKKYRLHPRLRGTVRFNYLNLVKDVYPSPMTGTMALDLILFRNVAIYLKQDVTQAIVGRFHGALRPGGWLLLGETELNIASSDGFDVEHLGQATFYHKTGGRDAELKAPVDQVPVLINVSASALSPNPAEIPKWVPLPAAEKPFALAPTPVFLERIQAAVEHRDFAAAERIIGSIPTRRERCGLRFKYVQTLLAQAEVARAHEMLDVCISDDPLSVESQLLKGSFAEEAGDLEAAEQAYRRALYVDRMCTIAHFHLGLVLQQKGIIDAARRSFQIVKRMAGEHDSHSLAEHGEGVCYGRLQEMAKRICDF